MWITRSRIAWLWTVFIFGVCWTPRRVMIVEEEVAAPFLFDHFDKVVHFALFAGFAFFWRWTGAVRVGWIVLAGIGATALSELGQWVPLVNRDATWPDAAADLLGVVGGLAIFALFRRIAPGRAAPRAGSGRLRAPSAETP